MRRSAALFLFFVTPVAVSTIAAPGCALDRRGLGPSRAAPIDAEVGADARQRMDARPVSDDGGGRLPAEDAAAPLAKDGAAPPDGARGDAGGPDGGRDAAAWDSGRGCGHAGEFCCLDGTCERGLECGVSLTCVLGCGAQGELCCAGLRCDGRLFCCVTCPGTECIGWSRSVRWED